MDRRISNNFVLTILFFAADSPIKQIVIRQEITLLYWPIGISIKLNRRCENISKNVVMEIHALPNFTGTGTVLFGWYNTSIGIQSNSSNCLLEKCESHHFSPHIILLLVISG